MAVKPCKECGREVSSKADKCPHCGAPAKRRTGCLPALGLTFLVLIFISWCSTLVSPPSERQPTTVDPEGSSPTAQGKPASKQAAHTMGETVHVGYTAYAVWQAWWANRLSTNEFLDQPPDASYLFLGITVRNDDKKARSIPPFKLIDENGAEYETSSKAWSVEGNIGVLDSLNPGVSKQGKLVFDVPKGHRYQLKVSGGYWSGDHAYIEIVPK